MAYPVKGRGGEADASGKAYPADHVSAKNVIITAAMIDHERTRPRRAGMKMLNRPWLPRVLLLSVALATLATTAHAQAVDCARLRAAIDTIANANDGGRFDMALRQQRDEIARTRAYADDSGCGGEGLFDDSESPQCRGLARRIQQLQVGLQRLQDQASRGDPEAEDRRQAMTDQFNAECSTEAAQEQQPAPREAPRLADPDALPPAAAPHAKVAHVLCVRHCDGAYYPLAVDVAADRLVDMDRICQAQCPAAESSAYASRDGEDVGAAQASDGTVYSTLTAAFGFRNGRQATCACRAPNQSWADALAGAEALIQTHKGDVTVTPALAASMARPAPAPPAGAAAGKAAAVKPSQAAQKGHRNPEPSPAIPTPDPLSPSDQNQDLTREFRQSDPTL